MNEQEARDRLADLGLREDQVNDMIACAKQYNVGTLIKAGVSTEYDRQTRTFKVITFDLSAEWVR